MEKRKDAQIYILYHYDTDYGVWDNSLYTPQSAFDSEIGELNPIYCETTGTYNVWKTRPKDLKYVGQCQYRRRLEFPEDFDFDKVFENFDIITASPADSPCTLKQQYADCHNVEDIELMEYILRANYPEYAKDWEEHINNGATLFYSQGYVMRAKDFDAYCSWLFSLLEKFCHAAGMDTVEQAQDHIFKAALAGKYGKITIPSLRYQTRICGYLAERLITTYIYHNFKKVQCFPYKKMEDIPL